jgi:hypothetical protein
VDTIDTIRGHISNSVHKIRPFFPDFLRLWTGYQQFICNRLWFVVTKLSFNSQTLVILFLIILKIITLCLQKFYKYPRTCALGDGQCLSIFATSRVCLVRREHYASDTAVLLDWASVGWYFSFFWFMSSTGNSIVCCPGLAITMRCHLVIKKIMQTKIIMLAHFFSKGKVLQEGRSCINLKRVS